MPLNLSSAFVATAVALGTIGLGACTNSDEASTQVDATVPPREAAPPSTESQFPAVPVSSPCLDSLAAADAVPIDESISAAIAASLSACASVNEWLSALRQYPGAMGMADAKFIGQLDVEVACSRNPQTPVCRDAAARGIPTG